MLEGKKRPWAYVAFLPLERFNRPILSCGQHLVIGRFSDNIVFRCVGLLLADFWTILFSDVSVYLFFIGWFLQKSDYIVFTSVGFFFICLFVRMSPTNVVRLKAFEPAITAQCPSHHSPLEYFWRHWPKMAYLGHMGGRHLGFWWKTRFGPSWPHFFMKVNHLGVCCRGWKALQHICCF